MVKSIRKIDSNSSVLRTVETDSLYMFKKLADQRS